MHSLNVCAEKKLGSFVLVLRLPPAPPPTTPPPGASPTPAPPTGTTPTPFDYSQFPQFNMSNYAQQGLGATPQFGDFNETLNRFFRFQ